MEKDIHYGQWWIIETMNGTEVLPADIIGSTIGDVVEACNDLRLGKLIEAEKKEGWGARLSMRGYLDCTEWSFHETSEDADEFLCSMYLDSYGDD